jgi:hypothetical protein
LSIPPRKGAPDLPFSYETAFSHRTSEATFQGDAVCVVPEPATVVVLACGAFRLALLLWRFV